MAMQSSSNDFRYERGSGYQNRKGLWKQNPFIQCMPWAQGQSVSLGPAGWPLRTAGKMLSVLALCFCLSSIMHLIQSLDFPSVNVAKACIFPSYPYRWTWPLINGSPSSNRADFHDLQNASVHLRLRGGSSFCRYFFKSNPSDMGVFQFFLQCCCRAVFPW